MPLMKNPGKLNEAAFQRLFNKVRADINELQLHDKVFAGVIEHLGKYKPIGINFPAFFGAFLAAMRTDLVIRLGRVYDPEGTGHDSPLRAVSPRYATTRSSLLNPLSPLV